MERKFLEFFQGGKYPESDAYVSVRECELRLQVGDCRDEQEPELENVGEEQEDLAVAGGFECEKPCHAPCVEEDSNCAGRPLPA